MHIPYHMAFSMTSSPVSTRSIGDRQLCEAMCAMMIGKNLQDPQSLSVLDIDSVLGRSTPGTAHPGGIMEARI
jgi:hypothetical protein